MSEQLPQDKLALIAQGLADENDYFQAGMTPEQIHRAAAIILAKEAVDYEGRDKQAMYQRNHRARKESA